MASTSKKRGAIASQMGRPKKGSLSSYSVKLRELIKSLRRTHAGWGAISILVELQEEYGYSTSNLPHKSDVNAFLKQEGFILIKERPSPLPVSNCIRPRRVHQLWEMDAKGAQSVSTIGYQSLINIKDGLSKKYCMSFPVAVKNYSTQPSTIHYKWALRLAFVESGLPKVIQVDKDSVFIENATKSPFPSRLHLWVIALGVELCFIDRPPPAKNAMVERSHQTLDKQVVKGQHYKSWNAFFKHCNKRRKRLNETFPSRSLANKAPLQAYPKAKHSGRFYAIDQEKNQLDLNRIYQFLSKGKWYRKISSAKGVHLGGKRYHVNKGIPKTGVSITFNKKKQLLVFRDVNELVLAQLPIKGLSKKELMGGQSKQLIMINERLFSAKDFPLAK